MISTSNIICPCDSNTYSTTTDITAPCSNNVTKDGTAYITRYHGEPISSYKITTSEYIAEFCNGKCIEKHSIDEFTKIEMLVPNKVMRFTFYDGTVVKTICREPDVFNFEFAFFLALAKKRYNKDLTLAGIEYEAKYSTYVKDDIKLVNKGMKLYNKTELGKAEKIAAEKERKEIEAHRRAKRAAKKAKAREIRIEEMAEAYRRANEK